ncbi:hypothetical protein [Thomasclavelia cocleata]|uniref:hypothetical protein n=1 Tax=Thomasclavelia cocleata TaxID=69824 RepID=UPI00242FD064|nr:hypothetical protein [Thomasclavelia cocleata]
MKKEKLIEILESLGIAVNEGESSVSNSSRYPRIVFWDYIWEDKIASDETYSTVETYQISFFAKEPRHPKLIELRNELRKFGIYPVIQHEYIKEQGKDRSYYHSFFNIEVVVDYG